MQIEWLDALLYRVSVRKCEMAQRVWRYSSLTGANGDVRRGRDAGRQNDYFSRWSEINEASSAGSTTPSRVSNSLPWAKKCVVG